MKKPLLIASDFESILAPEIWPAIAKATGIEDLKMTSREFPNFHELTRRRIRILGENNLKVSELQTIVDKLEPLPGALEFLSGIRKAHQVIVVSGGLDKLIQPFFKKLNYPTVFTYFLETNDKDEAVNFMPLEKSDVVSAFKKIGYRIVAAGDAHNDIDMLRVSDLGILFRSSDEIRSEYPQFPTVDTYEELYAAFNNGARGKTKFTPQSSPAYPLQK